MVQYGDSIYLRNLQALLRAYSFYKMLFLYAMTRPIIKVNQIDYI